MRTISNNVRKAEHKLESIEKGRALIAKAAAETNNRVRSLSSALAASPLSLPAVLQQEMRSAEEDARQVPVFLFIELRDV
jgi:hypothetical protein